MARTLTLPVRTFSRITPTARRLTLDLDGHRFDFHAGQAALVGASGQPGQKPFSIACAPEQARAGRCLEFLVKTDASGRPSAPLADLRKGRPVDLEGPIGRFRFPDAPSERHFLFVAGGTGIAPLRAMLWHVLLERRPGRIGVIYSARTPRELAYAGELRELERTGAIRLRFTVTRDAGPGWRGARGRIDRELLAAALEDRDTLCFVCGPPSLVESVPALLSGLGISASRIKKEEW